MFENLATQKDYMLMGLPTAARSLIIENPNQNHLLTRPIQSPFYSYLVESQKIRHLLQRRKIFARHGLCLFRGSRPVNFLPLAGFPISI